MAKSINEIWSHGAINESVVRRWIQKVGESVFRIRNEGSRGHPSIIENNKSNLQRTLYYHLNYFRTSKELRSCGSSVNRSRINWMEIEKITILKNRVSSTQSKLLVYLLCFDKWWKLDPLGQPATTGLVIGHWWSSATPHNAKIAPKKGNADCLVVGCELNTLLLFGFWLKDYDKEDPSPFELSSSIEKRIWMLTVWAI